MTATKPKTYFKTESGKMLLGDSLDVLRSMKDGSVDLIMTSPPFGLLRKKEYGNVDADGYVDWFRPFADEFRQQRVPQGGEGEEWNSDIIASRGCSTFDISDWKASANAPGNSSSGPHHTHISFFVADIMSGSRTIGSGRPLMMRVDSTLTCTIRRIAAIKSRGSPNQPLGSLTMPLSLSCVIR